VGNYRGAARIAYPNKGGSTPSRRQVEVIGIIGLQEKGGRLEALTRPAEQAGKRSMKDGRKLD